MPAFASCVDPPGSFSLWIFECPVLSLWTVLCLPYPKHHCASSPSVNFHITPENLAVVSTLPGKPIHTVSGGHQALGFAYSDSAYSVNSINGGSRKSFHCCPTVLGTNPSLKNHGLTSCRAIMACLYSPSTVEHDVGESPCV